jgi:hypothetical protein
MDDQEKLTQTNNRAGLFVGPKKDILILGEALNLIENSSKITLFKPPIFAGRKGIKGDHPDTLFDSRRSRRFAGLRKK